jgi:hypothetical protein
VEYTPVYGGRMAAPERSEGERAANCSAHGDPGEGNVYSSVTILYPDGCLQYRYSDGLLRESRNDPPGAVFSIGVVRGVRES